MHHNQSKMSLNVIKKVIDLGDGRTIEIETGKLAKQADGSVVIKMGDTMLLATVVSSPDAKKVLIFYRYLLIIKKNMQLQAASPVGFYAARHVYQTMRF